MRFSYKKRSTSTEWISVDQSKFPIFEDLPTGQPRMVALLFEEMKVPLFSLCSADTYGSLILIGCHRTVLRSGKSGLRKLKKKSTVRIQQETKIHRIKMEIAKISDHFLVGRNCFFLKIDFSYINKTLHRHCAWGKPLHLTYVKKAKY